MPYLVLVLFMSIIFYHTKRPKELKSKSVILLQNQVVGITVFILILFFGLRYDVGVDYMSYYNSALNHSYDKPKYAGGDEYFEPLFILLYATADFFALPKNTIFMFTGILINIFFFFDNLQAF